MIGTDEDEFLRILCSHSFIQLKDIFKHYDRLTGHSMETAIAKEFSGDLFAIFNAIELSSHVELSSDLTIKSFLIKIWRALRQSVRPGALIPKEWPQRRKRLSKGLLTSHTNSQRQDIKSTYKTMYGRDLEEDLKKDLGGSFE
ncbi:unnamed protein product, partial [Oppiella nova]